MMKKKLKVVLTSLVILVTIGVKSQNIDGTYALAKSIGVGCNSGNILLESTKKVKIKATKSEATLFLKSIACSKEVKMMGLPPQNNDEQVIYYNPQKNIILVVYKNNTIALANKKHSTKPYIINSVGASSKKEAKKIASKVGGEYNLGLSDSELSKLVISTVNAEKEAARAKAAKENLVDFPDKGFKDSYGVGGVYYLSKPLEIDPKTQQYTDKVQIEHLVDELNNINLYSPKGKMLGYCQSKKYQVAKNIFSWNMKQSWGSEFNKTFSQKDINQLETGVILIGNVMTGGYEKRGVVDYEKLTEIIAKFNFMAKDKARLEALKKNPRELANLWVKFIDKLRGSRAANLQANNPLPKEGMSKTQRILRKRALTAMQERAKKEGWKTTIEAAYVTGTKWDIIYHRVTGRILGRTTSCVMIEKRNGKCQWRGFTIRQDYNGSGYNKIPYCSNYRSAQYYPVSCSKTNNYK